MKNKLISTLMFLITILIIATAVFIGIIAWEEIYPTLMQEQSSIMETANKPQNENQEVETTAKVEVPQIRNKTSEEKEGSTTEQDLLDLIKPSNPTEAQEKQETITKHFYDQLNEQSQKIYNALEENKENMKTGTYRIKLGTTFSDTLSKENGQEMLGNYYQSAIESYIYDNPDVFYLSPNKMYLNIETITKGNQKTYNTYIDNGGEENYFIEGFSTKQDIDQALTKLESIKNKIAKAKTGNTYKDIKMVHDFLVEKIEYDQTISKENIYNIYGALINKECVCEGYAKAFKYLLDGLGIDSVLVIGQATNTKGQSENHAWNYVQLDGKWYAVDTTWDDPIVIGGGTVSSSIKYKYFLKGESLFSEDHFPQGKFTENGMEFKYPQISKQNYK